MKVNLLRNSPNTLSGYTNIDSFAKDGDTEKVGGDITNLDHIVDDGECEEIVAGDIINYLDLAITGQAIKNWVSKLKKGGRIVLGATNIHMLSKAILIENVSANQINETLHGNENTPWNIKKSTYTIDYVAGLIESFGLKITSIRTSDLKFTVIAERQ